MAPKPHLTKCTVVTAIKIRRFATQAEAEAERDNAVERGKRAYIIAPLEAWARVPCFWCLRNSLGEAAAKLNMIQSDLSQCGRARASAYERVFGD